MNKSDRRYTNIGVKMSIHRSLEKIAKLNRRPISQQVALWVEEECIKLGLPLPAENQEENSK